MTTSTLIDNAVQDGYVKFIKSDRLVLGEKGVVGAFSEAHEAKLGNQYSSVTVTAKVLRSFEEGEETLDEEIKSQFFKQLKHLRDIECHPNILNFWGISKAPDTGRYILVQEYADCGPLWSYLAKNFDKLTDDRKLQLAREIAAGVACLHEEDIVHGDLNSHSILVHQGHIKISDLGIAKRINQDIAHSSSTIRAQLQYIDPQYYLNIGYIRNRKSDIYSIGVLFWELTSGRVAFENSREAVVAYIVNGLREEPIQGTPQPFVELYTKCWDQTPANRPEIHEVCETLNGFDWSSDTSSETSDDTSIAPDFGAPRGAQLTEINKKVTQWNAQLQTQPNDDDNDLAERKARWNENEIEFLDRATQIVKEGLDEGEEFVEIGSVRVATYLQEKQPAEKGLADILVGDKEPLENIREHPYALLLGFSYYVGLGLPHNYDLAYKAFLVAVYEGEGDSYADYFIGYCHHHGHGTKLNKQKAFKWYKKSADKGNLNGQYGLGHCYRTGCGTPKDLTQAFEWYKKSAEGKFRLAQYWVGGSYRRGTGVKKDVAEAKRWYKLSADQGYSLAADQLKDKSWQRG